MPRDAPARVLLLCLATGCAEERAPDVESLDPPSESTPAAPEAPSRVPPALDGPAFDFRRVRVEPEEHTGEERLCDVAFSDVATPIEPREQGLYPEGATARRTLRCAAESGGGWLEVVFDDPADAERAIPGRRIALVVEAVASGRHGYVVARFARDLGEARTEPAPATAEASARAPGADFSRLEGVGSGALSTLPCAVDFVGEIVHLSTERRRRSGYPEGTRNRIDVKCLHADGESWIDLIFDVEQADRALDVVPGTTLDVEIVAASGGFADRPVVRWVSR